MGKNDFLVYQTEITQMNERIKELLYEAGGQFDGGDRIRTEDVDYEKFAELIIKECCQFEKAYSGDAGLVARSYSRKIKDHFSLK